VATLEVIQSAGLSQHVSIGLIKIYLFLNRSLVN